MTVELWSFSRTLGVDSAELRGMSVEARDGGMGEVVDVVEGTDAACLIVDTGPWILGKQVVLPAGVVTGVDRARARVFVDRIKDEVKNAPEADPDATDFASHRAALTAHYGARQETAAPTALGAFGSAPSPPAEPVPPQPEGLTGAPRAETSEPEGLTGAPRAETSEPEDLTPAPRAETSEPPTGDRLAAALDETAPQEQDAGERAPAKGRFARDGDSSAAKGGTGAKRGSSGDVPIARYDRLTATEVLGKLRNLSQRELTQVERHEKRNEGRRTVLDRIESLREEAPWRGYDDATVDEIRKKLADADEERARTVRDYERRHRNRKGVMERARRAVASP